ncbi:MAG: pirin family protein [Candidatus Lutacidiplasmatales archaeon]
MSDHPRAVVQRFPPVETMEGAGVRLRRSFGNGEVPLFDPFLLLDNFGSSNPEDYLAGFPWHPHRGIETVTYMLEGRVDHGDSLGNAGSIDAGDVQWMTAGSGIIHQEMPQRTEGSLRGFQLWVNLPSREKMTTPAYRGLTSPELPTESTPDGGRVRVVAGEYGSVQGPVGGISVSPTYLDVTLLPDSKFQHPIPVGHTSFAHTVSGSVAFGAASEPFNAPGETLLFGPGHHVAARAGPLGGRFLLVAGRPLGEPVAWYGPIVMNHQEELAQAVRDLRAGTFIRDRKTIVEE